MGRARLEVGSQALKDLPVSLKCGGLRVLNFPPLESGTYISHFLLFVAPLRPRHVPPSQISPRNPSTFNNFLLQFTPPFSRFWRRFTLVPPPPPDLRCQSRLRAYAIPLFATQHSQNIRLERLPKNRYTIPQLVSFSPWQKPAPSCTRRLVL